LFSALLGFNPIKSMLAPTGALARLPARNAAILTGKQFFPNLISGPFHHGLVIVFSAAIAMSVLGALISLLRGKQFYYAEPEAASAPVGDQAVRGETVRDEALPAEAGPAEAGPAEAVADDAVAAEALPDRAVPDRA
jgi:hypothetical protein